MYHWILEWITYSFDPGLNSHVKTLFVVSEWLVYDFRGFCTDTLHLRLDVSQTGTCTQKGKDTDIYLCRTCVACPLARLGENQDSRWVDFFDKRRVNLTIEQISKRKFCPNLVFEIFNPDLVELYGPTSLDSYWHAHQTRVYIRVYTCE